MLAIVSRCRWYILVGLLLLTICTSAAADVTIRGRVRVWSPITNAYVPLRQARVRIVLWEFEDWDTGDLEVWTDDNGNYRGTKGNPWWRSGYNVFIKAFAETDRLEVQDTIPEVDGYQAYAGQVWAPEDNTTEINLDIGGARSNVTGFRVGGISCFGTASDTGRQNGERAFWICHEMTDHVLWLMGNTVIPTRYFEEKECAFPYNDDPTANFSYTWDAVYVPDATFAGSLEYQSHTFRHELGHGLMLDAYGLLDLPGSGSGPSHSFWTPIGNNEQAWKEGSSDFLADWTFFQAYGRPADDVTSISNPARDASFSAHPGNRESIEGEIDGALWLLTDPKGWKERLVQVPGRPEPNMWYDLFEDGAFTDFWPIFEGREPARFSDMSGEDSDTYVNYLASLYPDNKYDLKVLLAQRGIEIWGGEHVPIIDYNGPITWNGPDCTIPVYLEERDQLDLGHLTVEVYVNGARVLQQPVPNTGWEREDSYRLQGWKQPFEFVYHHIAPRPGHVSGTAQRNPRIRIVLDDGMTYAAHFENLNPPAGAQIGDLRCNVWRAVIKNSGDSRLKNIGVNVGLSGVEPSVKLGPWNVDSWMRRNWEGDSEVFRMTGGTVPDSFSLEFTATGSGKGGAGSALGTVTQTFSDTEGFGIGDHVVTIPLGNQLGGEAEVSYSIFLPDPVREARTHIPQAVLDQARGIARTPLGARNINPDVLRQAAYDTPGQNLRILAGQASHLLDDYARLQASVLEIEEEIEAKLNPQKAAVFESNKYLPGAVNPAGKEIRLLRPGAGARQVMLQTPDTPFLDTVTYGKGDVAAIPKQGIKALQEMRASIEEKQKETVDLCEQAPKLRTKLLQSADVVRSSTLTEEAKNRLLSGVPDLADRLSNLNPSADAFNPIMVKEKQVIDFALGRKPSEKEPTTTYEKLPGTLLPGATPPPMEKYPPKEAPPKEKLPGLFIPKTQSPNGPPPAEQPTRTAETARWKLQVLNVQEADEYAEQYYQEKRVIQPKNKGDKLILLPCRLTNKLEKIQTPILTERLAGSTMLSVGANGAFPPLDFDACQAINKWQGYDAASVAPGGSLDFVLVFEVPSGSQADMLIFTFMNYPEDVGSEGKTVKIPL
jgi:hypothetical protein